MILVDTSVWVDHLRSGNAELAALLDAGQVLMHPAVNGELALGGLRHPDQTLDLLVALPAAIEAEHTEVLTLIRAEGFAGSGIGYLDAQLLASVRLTPSAKLWTHDPKLEAVATGAGVDYRP